MLEDKFKFTRANILLIIFNVILILLVIFASVQLIMSLKDSGGEIPELKTTAGKSSTKYADATSTTSVETTTTTTKKQGNPTSPYYNADIYSIVDKNLREKENLSKDERIELGKQFFKLLEGVLEGSDDDLINVTHLLRTAKDGESDKVTVNGNAYGKIYGGEKFLATFMGSEAIFRIQMLKKDGVKVIYKNDTTYDFYKLGSTTGEKTYEVTNYRFNALNENEYIMSVIYKDLRNTDKKNNDVKSAEFNVKYSTYDKRWEIYSISGFPNLEV